MSVGDTKAERPLTCFGSRAPLREGPSRLVAGIAVIIGSDVAVVVVVAGARWLA